MARIEEVHSRCCPMAGSELRTGFCTYPYDFTIYQETLSRVRTCADASVLEPDISPRITRLMANPAALPGRTTQRIPPNTTSTGRLPLKPGR